jgi:hypothetical protein
MNIVFWQMFKVQGTMVPGEEHKDEEHLLVYFQQYYLIPVYGTEESHSKK